MKYYTVNPYNIKYTYRFRTKTLNDWKKEVNNMSKYYRVMLYDLTKEKGYVVSNNMGYIIVKESMFHLKDVMTNYHLGIIHKGSQMCNVVENVKLPSCGHLPIIYERDLTTDNYATEKDVD